MKTMKELAPAVALLWLGAVAGAAAEVERQIPPAFGPHVNLASRDFTGSKSFGSDERMVGTYYFYWYNIDTREHILNGDGSDALTDHPHTLDDFSYRSVRWHKKELSDMIVAGIDVVLPVFWGAPSEQVPTAHLHWSYAGLKPLVEAREELAREGKSPPYIGLFYDTSTLQHNTWREHIDLTTRYGQSWFYATIRDFFSMVPPKHWAMIDGRPVVLLYSAAFAKKHDQRAIDFVKEQFPREFGGRVPYIAREISWHVQADNVVAWGGALGCRDPGIASLGPGYDHSAVPGRAPLIVKRDDGKFYETNWFKVLRRAPRFVMVETWNEFHEGTEVCESKEYGRQYLELTRKYADRFKQGWRPPWPAGKYTGAKSVSMTLGKSNQESGLRQLENEDGQTVATTAGGRDGRGFRPTPGRSRYMYFIVDDSFKSVQPMDAALEVDFFDAAAGSLAVEFDGSDAGAPFGGAYTRGAPAVKLTETKTWRTAVFELRGARFLNSQNRSADFRLVVEAPEFHVRQVTLRRR